MKRMMKCCFFLVVGLLLQPVMGWADTPTVTASELAEQLKFYKPIRELRAHFRQVKHLSEMNLDLKSEGQLTFVRPNDIEWEIHKPNLLTVKMNDSEVRITSKSGAEISTQTFKISELPKDTAAAGIGLLKPWLMLDAESLGAHYKVTRPAPRTYSFEPKDGPRLFSKIETRLNSKGHVERLVLFEMSGDRMEIDFDEPKVVRSKN